MVAISWTVYFSFEPEYYKTEKKKMDSGMISIIVERIQNPQAPQKQNKPIWNRHILKHLLLQVKEDLNYYLL